MPVGSAAGHAAGTGVTAGEYRRMALALEEVVEAEHMGHPDFRVGGKIFASLQQGLRAGSVMLSPQDQADFIAAAPDAFMPESGAWGRAGWTRIQFATAGEEMVGEALTLAWRRRIALTEEQKHRKTPARAPRAKPAARKATKKR